MPKTDPLASYKAKRNFAATPEPQAGGQPNPAARAFVIQKHWARQLHYDFRLELDGSMKSWAVPKGPSLDPAVKRMAVQVEDHPLSYNRFEGEIPPKQYGAGRVIIWDHGVWTPLGDPQAGYRDGHLKFELAGHKLAGRWVLVRMKAKGEKQRPWLLIKEADEHARPAAEYSVVDALPGSVASLPPGGQASAAPTKGKAGTQHAAPAGRTQQPGAAAGGIPAAAVKAALPATLEPQLATLSDSVPGAPDAWRYEIKFDGYRMLVRIEGADIRLYTRNGHDWSAKLPSVVHALAQLDIASAWLDGEIVLLDSAGKPDFQALQGAFDQARTEEIVLYLFDVPFYGGYDVRDAPLVERQQLLAALLEKQTSPSLRLSEAFEGTPQQVRESACRLGLEGVIGKRKTARYRSRRSPDWIKLKCAQRQEFVVGGYTDPNGSRPGIGALLVGVYDREGKLHYSGKVGTGFDQRTLRELKKKLTPLARATRPFVVKTDNDSGAHWVNPRLVAEVSFGEWTAAGRLRHAVFKGLRADKPPTLIVREQSIQGAVAPEPKPGDALKVAVSHPERVVDASTGTTKLQIVAFYARVAPLMMSHLKDRPVSLVRAPAGLTGQLFFQKHLDASPVAGIRALDPSLDPGHAPLLEVAKGVGLQAAAQMNVLEFHTWNARSDNIAKPDRMTFDLDPGEGVAWCRVQEAAQVVQAFLAELGLVSFLKTSGGKGLHIVVPIKRRYDWDTVKAFSHAIVRHLAETVPARFAAKSGPRNRVGKVFIDYLRNGFGATTVAAWSVRARAGLGISVPLGWNELDLLEGGTHWTLANIHTRLEIGNAPWHDYAGSAQALTPAMKRLGFERTPSQ